MCNEDRVGRTALEHTRTHNKYKKVYAEENDDDDDDDDDNGIGRPYMRKKLYSNK